MTTTARRVLVVDDEGSLRLTLAANLELEGFVVSEAASADEALLALQQGTFNLLVTDIRMPGMNGVELFRHVRDTYPGMPVLLMTAFAQEDLVEAALGEGAWAVLDKPFDVAHAIKVISRAAQAPAVLVVDDAEVAQQTAQSLVGRGLKASDVSDAPTAVKMLAERAIDVCVLELARPELNGPQLFAQLRAQQPELKGIVLSGETTARLMQQLAALGVFAFFRKPFSPAELARTIARARASRGGRC